MKKLNWGHYIIIFFIGYIGFLIFVLVKSSQVNHSLVIEDYYTHDINYQAQYELMENAKIYNKEVKLDWNDLRTMLNVSFNDTEVKSGKIHMYNPAKKELDFTFSFKDKKGEVSGIEESSISPGRWKVIIEWEDNLRSYRVEEEFYKNKL